MDVSTILGIANSGLNSTSQFGNMAYQHYIQNQLFAREDNAVQRRMNDLKAAGINPNLAAGSSANAGAVISTKSPEFNLGNALDYKAAQEQINYQQAQTNNAKVTNDILNNQYQTDKLKRNIEQINFNNLIGLPSYINSRGQVTTHDVNGTATLIPDNSPVKLMFNLGLMNQENNASLLQNQVDFMKSDKFIDYSSAFAGALFKLLK